MSRQRFIIASLLFISAWPVYACEDGAAFDFFDLLTGYVVLALLSSPVAGIAAHLASPGWQKRAFWLVCLISPFAVVPCLLLGIFTPIGVPLALCAYVVLLWGSVVGLRYMGGSLVTAKRRRA